MMDSELIPRRKFIRLVALSSGSLLLLPRCGNSLNKPWRFFTVEEALLVDAIVEQIIPTDEWMGAKDAGVTNFIDKQLVTHLSRFQNKYRDGLYSLSITCQEVHHKKFHELSWNDQTEFLKEIENGSHNELTSIHGKNEGGRIWNGGGDSSFFRLIRDHTMAGFYGSPRHGGNYKYVSYRMIGLDYPVVQGRNKHV
ncbi:MAG: gluconate 2-dehydrogenase subunit 3 family protein [Fermentimonas sp.]|jgi:gluconate 2-dehydrogenase gamma chain